MRTTHTPRTRRRGAAALLAGAALLLAACAPPGADAEDPTDDPAASEDGTDEAAGGETFTVGYISPLTGPVAVAGQEMVQGWELYWELNGNQVGDITIETIVEDDAGNPENSLTKARRLVESEDVDLLVGPLLANTALAVAAYASDVGVPNFHPVAASDDLTQRQQSPLVLRTGSLAGSQMNFPAGEWALEQGHRSAVTLCPDYAFGWESCAGFVSTFTDGGGTLADQLWYPLGTQDFSPYVSQIQASGADITYVATAGGADGPNFLKTFTDFGVRDQVDLLMNCCSMDQATIRALGDSTLGVNSVSYWAEGRDAPEVQELVDAYSAAYDGNLPSLNVAGGYTTAMVVAATLEEAGLVGGEEFVAAARGLTIPDSVFGQLTFDDHNNSVMPVYIREVQEMADGTLRNVPIQTYDDVSQFWTYDPEEFMAGEPFSRTNNGER